VVFEVIAMVEQGGGIRNSSAEKQSRALLVNCKLAYALRERGKRRKRKHVYQHRDARFPFDALITLLQRRGGDACCWKRDGDARLFRHKADTGCVG
jgi:hypothetical protein